MSLALRAIRDIRPMQGLPITDQDGVMRHGFSVINRTPITPHMANVVLQDHMRQVVESLRPHVADLLRVRPEAASRLKPLYTVAELLGTGPLLERMELWQYMLQGDWRSAAAEILACTRPAYMDASPEIRRKVNDVIFDMVTGISPFAPIDDA